MSKLDPITALGTVWWFELFEAMSETAADEISDLISRRLHTFEATYSRFISTSLLSELNTSGKLIDPPAEFTAILALGQAYYRQTDGVFNLLSGAQQEANGYDATYSFAATATPSIANPLVDLKITAGEILLEQGKVDVGGFAKGWLIDDLAARLTARGLTQFLINGGGDMFGTTEAGEPISITLEDPFTPKHYIGSITLDNQALAASSPTLRTWKDQTTGKQYSHFIDPRSGTTTTELAAFVRTKKAVTADLLATTFSIDPTQHENHPVDCLIIDRQNNTILQDNFLPTPLRTH